MEITKLFQKNRKVFLDNASSWDDKSVTWDVTVELFGTDSVAEVDSTIKLRATDGDAFELSIFCGSKENAEEHLAEVESVINQLAEYAEAVQEAMQYLPTNQEREEYWASKRAERIQQEKDK